VTSPFPVELIIFDLDGTLADTRADLTRAVNYALGRLHLPELSMETVCQYVGHGVQTLLTAALGPEHQERLSEGVKLFQEYYAAHLLDETRLYPGVRETLEHFRKKRKAIVTNKPLGYTITILRGLKIGEHFDLILGGDSTSERKPHPEPARKVLATLHTDPRRTAMVGDSPADIQMAKQAGLYSIAVTYGLRPREELVQTCPDLLLDTFPDLKTALI
jgi:phosphoglycolate phosphatase